MKPVFAAVVLLLATAPAHAESYTLSGDGWTCEGPGALLDIDQNRATDREIDKARCIPVLSDTSVTVQKFQGQYAYVCETVRGGYMGDTQLCGYALTKYLRDSHGQPVPAQVSKGASALRPPPPMTRD